MFIFEEEFFANMDKYQVGPKSGGALILGSWAFISFSGKQQPFRAGVKRSRCQTELPDLCGSGKLLKLSLSHFWKMKGLVSRPPSIMEVCDSVRLHCVQDKLQNHQNVTEVYMCMCVSLNLTLNSLRVRQLIQVHNPSEPK